MVSVGEWAGSAPIAKGRPKRTRVFSVSCGLEGGGSPFIS
jgi:hypothetical protein